MSPELKRTVQLFHSFFTEPIQANRRGSFRIAPDRGTVDKNVSMMGTYLGFVMRLRGREASSMKLEDYLDAQAMASYLVFMKVRRSSTLNPIPTLNPNAWSHKHPQP